MRSYNIFSYRFSNYLPGVLRVVKDILNFSSVDGFGEIMKWKMRIYFHRLETFRKWRTH